MASDPGLASRERLQRPGARIAFVVSNFHRDLTGAMLESACRELAASGVREDDVRVAWVPGSFELPLVARRFARRDDVDGVICIGLVLKGETTHDLHVAQGATRGIQQVMLETDKPVLFGVLTCDSLEQARARALPPDRGGVHDKGRELAVGVLETLAALDAARCGERPAGFPTPPTSPR
jgi:6,7-dimethyl-8-ribityllumazine synthase